MLLTGDSAYDTISDEDRKQTFYVMTEKWFPEQLVMYFVEVPFLIGTNT